MTRRLTMQQRIKQGLVAYWPLADLSAVDLKSRLYDARGPYDLTNNNTVTRAAGPSANLPSAASFVRASNQTLTVPDSPSISFAGTDFTLVFWGFIDGSLANNQAFATKDTGGAGGRELVINNISATNITFNLYDGTNSILGVGNTTTRLLNTWYMHTFTFERSTRRATNRINLGTPAVATATGDVGNTTTQLAFGGRPASALDLDGRMAPVGLWKRILVEAEIMRLYNNDLGYDLVRGV